MQMRKLKTKRNPVYIVTQNDGKLSKMLLEDYFFQITCLTLKSSNCVF